MTLPEAFHLSEQVRRALQAHQPLVALESTVITHGLPYPQNRELALDMESEVRAYGATPATIAVLAGQVHVGLDDEHLARLAQAGGMRKISTRDFGLAIAQQASGGTTVAATMLAAYRAGIQVFATGGIGGVHRQPAYDISADLLQLSNTPMIVVCAGAKAILDLPGTLEYLETVATPVIGYQTDTFPAFYSSSSGLPVSGRADSPSEVAAIARAHWGMSMRSAVLVAQPPPPELALPPEVAGRAIEQALAEAEAQHVRGQAMTPFLLQRVAELTGGDSLQANLGLLKNNARLAAQIAVSLLAA